MSQDRGRWAVGQAGGAPSTGTRVAENGGHGKGGLIARVGVNTAASTRQSERLGCASIPSLTCSSPANEIELPTQRSGARRGCARLQFSQHPNRLSGFFPIFVNQRRSDHYTFLNLKNAHYYLASFCLHGLTRAVTSRRGNIVFRLQRTSQSQRESQQPVSYS
jgi:hypothetical protein